MSFKKKGENSSLIIPSLVNYMYMFSVGGYFVFFFLVTLFQVPPDSVENMHNSGCLLVSTTYFERNVIANFQRDKETEDSHNRDVGFWVRLSPEGSWESVRSLLPLSVVPKSIHNEFFAMEVIMKNGKKHAIFRGLAIVVNDSDVKLDISICHVSLVHGHDPCLGTSKLNIVIEEIFENQRNNPISGWGNKWPRFRSNDPGRWSTRDFSYSSNVSIFVE